MTDITKPAQDDVPLNYAPCPMCKQYSHSLGTDKVAEAFQHFEMLIAHPLRGHPMGPMFDEKTRDYAQVLVEAIRRQATTDAARIAQLEADHCCTSKEPQQ